MHGLQKRYIFNGSRSKSCLNVLGVSDKFETRKGDAFATLEALAEEGAQFDIVICDPPAFAPGRKSLDAGLRAYERVARLAAGLVKEGGYLGVCSCSHAAELTKFRNASARGIGRGGDKGQLPDRRRVRGQIRPAKLGLNNWVLRRDGSFTALHWRQSLRRRNRGHCRTSGKRVTRWNRFCHLRKPSRRG